MPDEIKLKKDEIEKKMTELKAEFDSKAEELDTKSKEYSKYREETLSELSRLKGAYDTLKSLHAD